MPSSRRNSHATKSQEEQRSYRDNVVRPKPAPTVDLIPASDSTETAVSSAYATTPTITTTPTRVVQQHSTNWLREHLPEFGGVGVLLAVLGWLSLQLFGLNREVGELKIRLETIEKANADGAAAQTATEQRVQRQIERLEDRVERRDVTGTTSKRKP